MNQNDDHLTPWIGHVPKDWEVCRLDTVADVLFSNVDKHTLDGELPVRLCNYVDVYKNERIVRNLDFMEASAELREIAKFQIKAGDVLVTKDSEEADDIAIPALVAEDLPGVICGYHLALIRPRSKRVTGEFLAWLHRCKQFRAQYEAKAVGVTRFGLSQFAFRSARIPLPPLDEQIRINRYLDLTCSAVDSIAASGKPNGSNNATAILSQQASALQAYRNAIIFECVTGVRRIKDDDFGRFTI